MATDGPAALRRLADKIDPELDHGAISTSDADDMRQYADDWQAEREQAAADRAALERARALLAEADARRMTRYETEDYASFWDGVNKWLGGAR